MIHAGNRLILIVEPEALSGPLDELETLLSLSAQEGITLYVAGDDPHPDWPKIGSARVLEDLDRGVQKLVLSQQDKIHEVLVDRGRVQEILRYYTDARGYRTSDTGAVMAMAALELYPALLVSADEGLLIERYNAHSIFNQSGICTISEAISIALSVLRGRQIFAIDKPGHHLGCDETAFYNALTNFRLPTVVEAYRTALDPAHRQTTALLVENLESLLTKFESLLISDDECGRLLLTEGLYGGENSRISKYVGNSQYALALFSGILDVIANLTAELTDRTGKKASINWTNLLKEGKPFFNSLSGQSECIQKVALTAPLVNIDVILGVRHYYSHQAAIPARVARFELPGDASECGTYCLFDLGKVVDDRKIDLPEELLGTFSDGCIQPRKFHKIIVDTAISVIESVAKCLDLGGGDWCFADGGRDRDSYLREISAVHSRYWQ